MKSKIVAGIFGILLGSFGIHKFYLGKPVVGILYILFFWTAIPGLVGFFEGIMYLGMRDIEFNRKYNPNIEDVYRNKKYLEDWKILILTLTLLVGFGFTSRTQTFAEDQLPRPTDKPLLTKTIDLP